MAVTKILAKRARLDVIVNYALNGDKTEEGILTAYHNCTAGNPYRQMKDAKDGKTEGVVGYHIIQSFAKGEIQPEQALRIAKQYAQECLPGYMAVIGTHVDKEHVHNHIVFSSVNMVTGKKYHSSPQSYFEQIRGISDRLCAENGLSVIMRGEQSQSVNYSVWLREQKGQSTFDSMLKADIKLAAMDANDFGHFLMLMEHMGYEMDFGKNLGFRLRGQDHFMRPSRRDPVYTEDGIRSAIQGNLEAIETGAKPVFTPRQPFVPYQPYGKLKGFLGLYVHYLYLLGNIQKQQYPPRMTPHLKSELVKFDRYKSQFAFMRKNGIETPEQMRIYRTDAEARLAALAKRRTILNVQKKKQKALYDALADAEALRPVKELYISGVSGIEDEFTKYMDAMAILEKSDVPLEQLKQEKSKIYQAIAEVNREMRLEKRNISLCDEISGAMSRMEKDIQSTRSQTKEVMKDERRKR